LKLFANNTDLTFSDSNLDKLQLKLDDEVTTTDWMKIKKLTMNCKTTEFMF